MCADSFFLALAVLGGKWTSHLQAEMEGSTVCQVRFSLPTAWTLSLMKTSFIWGLTGLKKPTALSQTKADVMDKVKAGTLRGPKWMHTCIFQALSIKHFPADNKSWSRAKNLIKSTAFPSTHTASRELIRLRKRDIDSIQNLLTENCLELL